MPPQQTRAKSSTLILTEFRSLKLKKKLGSVFALPDLPERSPTIIKEAQGPPRLAWLPCQLGRPARQKVLLILANGWTDAWSKVVALVPQAHVTPSAAFLPLSYPEQQPSSQGPVSMHRTLKLREQCSRVSNGLRSGHDDGFAAPGVEVVCTSCKSLSDVWMLAVMFTVSLQFAVVIDAPWKVFFMP